MKWSRAMTLPFRERQHHAAKIDAALEELKIAQGIMLSELNKRKTSRCLKDFEFKVFSQWGEDGIIQRLVDVVTVGNKTFIEFGVESFRESNCRFLMMKDNWSGFVIDGSQRNIEALQQSYYFWRYDLAAVSAFITRGNINDLLRTSGFGEDVGILSVDLDGNDYYILDAIQSIRPRILICEYNALFGRNRLITIPYDENFRRKEKHQSTLYYGASLGAIAELAARKGYVLVGTNSAGNNSFFVRRDLISDRLEALTTEGAFTSSKFREARDRNGELTYLSAHEGATLIRGLPVVNVITNQQEVF